MAEHSKTDQRDKSVAPDALADATTDPFFADLIRQINDLEAPSQAPEPAANAPAALDERDGGPVDGESSLDALESELLGLDAASLGSFDAPEPDGEPNGLDALGAAIETETPPEPTLEPPPEPADDLASLDEALLQEASFESPPQDDSGQDDAPVTDASPPEAAPPASASAPAPAPAPAPPESADHPPAPAAPGDEGLSLKPLDEAIVQEADDLLAGDYESVDDMLEGAPADEGSVADELGGDVEPAPLEPVAAQESAAAAAPAPDPGPAPAPAPAPAPDPAPAQAPASQQPGTPEAEGDAAPRAGIVGILRLLNRPVQALSPSARIIVDLLALSLLMWIPIVWIIALFVVG